MFAQYCDLAYTFNSHVSHGFVDLCMATPLSMFPMNGWRISTQENRTSHSILGAPPSRLEIKSVDTCSTDVVMKEGLAAWIASVRGTVL